MKYKESLFSIHVKDYIDNPNLEITDRLVYNTKFNTFTEFPETINDTSISILV